MRRSLSIAMVFAVFLAAVPSAGLAALCATDGGVHKACCCKHELASEPDGDRCCCDLGSPAERRGASFLPQERMPDRTPTWVVVPVLAANDAPARSTVPAAPVTDWLPPPGGPPVYLRVLHFLI